MIDFNKECIWVPDTDVCLRMESVDAIKLYVPRKCEQLMDVECHAECYVLVLASELCKGVFVAGMIGRPVNGIMRVKVMNVNDEDVCVTNYRPEIMRLDEFECVEFELIDRHSRGRVHAQVDEIQKHVEKKL